MNMLLRCVGILFLMDKRSLEAAFPLLEEMLTEQFARQRKGRKR